MILPSIGWVVVIALAVYRVVRVICCDSISAPLRGRLFDWAWVSPGDEGYDARLELALIADPRTTSAAPLPRSGGLRTWLYDLLTCAHCLGVWFSIAGYSAWRWGGNAALTVLAVLAVAGAQSVLVSALPDDSVDAT